MEMEATRTNIFQKCGSYRIHKHFNRKTQRISEVLLCNYFWNLRKLRNFPDKYFEVFLKKQIHNIAARKIGAVSVVYHYWRATGHRSQVLLSIRHLSEKLVESIT